MICESGESYSDYSKGCVRSCKDGYERLYPETECLKKCDDETEIRNPLTRRCRTIDMFADNTNKSSALYGFDSIRTCGSKTKSGNPCNRRVASGLHCYQHTKIQIAKNGTRVLTSTQIKSATATKSNHPIKSTTTTKPTVTKSTQAQTSVNATNAKLRTCASKKKNLVDNCSRQTNCMFCWQHGYYPYGETNRSCGYKLEEDINGALVPINR